MFIFFLPPFFGSSGIGGGVGTPPIIPILLLFIGGTGGIPAPLLGIIFGFCGGVGFNIVSLFSDVACNGSVVLLTIVGVSGTTPAGFKLIGASTGP